MTLNMAVLLPTPIASATTATAVNPGSRAKARRLCRRSTMKLCIRRNYLGMDSVPPIVVISFAALNSRLGRTTNDSEHSEGPGEAPGTLGRRWAAEARFLSKIRREDALVLAQVRGRSFDRDPPPLHHVRIIRHLLRRLRELLHEQHRHPLLLQALDGAEHLLHDDRREAHGRLVKKHHLGLRH